MSAGLTKAIDMTFSIITINLNNACGLEDTILSVTGQTCDDYEFIVIDGASTDGSLEVAESYRSKLDVLVSEKDGGIYDAMNKGVARASGEYLIFLNSGDRFASTSVLSEVKALRPEADILIGRYNASADGAIVKRDCRLRHDHVTLFSLYMYGLPHQACFIRRELQLRHPYDTGLKINADWKFFLQAIVFDGCPYSVIPVVVSDYDCTGLSSTDTEGLRAERDRVFCEMIPAAIADDYCKVFPHYYETYRMEWLLRHPVLYKLYRLSVSAGMKILK